MADTITCRVITGPTASGKSEAAVRIAEAEGWDIVCMDSMQIYRRMNIGTAKPAESEMRGIPHHMLDICEPYESYSVSDYRDTAEKLVVDLYERTGKEVLFVGGTTLYLQALMHPMAMGQVPANEQLRKELRDAAQEPEGRRALHARLERIDPVTAGRLPVNDVRRIIRAIEVYEATGRPFSEQPERADREDGRFRWIVVSTAMERTLLYSRINRRVSEMINRGLADEVRALLQEGVPEDAQSMSGLGYKEMIPFLRGEYSLEDAAERIRTGTRHYAKRQMTFLRREESVRYVSTEQTGACEEIRKILKEDIR